VLAARVVTAVEELEPFLDEWDGLAVKQGRPFSAPGWALAWWQHMRPDRAELRVVLVRDRDSLVGVAPLYALGAYLHPIGRDVGSAEIVSASGLEAEVAAAAAPALTTVQHRPVAIELQCNSDGPDWPALLDASWATGRGAWTRLGADVPVPGIDLDGGRFEAWLNEKSASFRRDIRRNQRKLENDQGAFRLTTSSTLERDVGEFMRLHRMRQEGRTSLGSDQVVQMLVAAGSKLLPQHRFRLYCLEMGGSVIAAQLMVAAGPVTCAWNSGFDGAYGRYSPSIQCLVRALIDADQNGERTFSLGTGGQDYKSRMATREDRLRTYVIVPHGPTYPINRLRVEARTVRNAAEAFLRRKATGAKVRLARRAN
jgi:CelD/BcsL family acetyltransferase involved in cellulose biosynthesis